MRYIEDWAEVAEETLMEMGVSYSESVAYFMRTATVRTTQMTSFFTLGEQNTSFDSQDGMLSALIGKLNAQLSGFSLTHSEIGGYTNTAETPRTQNLIFRWIEFSALADVVMRSHPSNLPEAEQVWSSSETLQHLKKFVELHVILAQYKRYLMNEAQFFGTPVVRPLMLHYPDSNEALQIFD